MATNYSFTPTTTVPYSFQPTLDGIVYNASVPWNIFGQRFYLLIKDSNGNLVINIPLISSSEQGWPPINLLAGYFKTSTLYYYAEDKLIVVGP